MESEVDTFKQNNITLSNVKLEFQANREKLSSISTELGQMTEELDMYKAQMDELGSGMTDAKPLVNIKQAISRLKTEIKQLDLKTGVVEQRLWHSRMQEKGVTHRMEETMIFT
ncbi:Intra-flagellar transport protein 57 domain-containing protein [Rozella allomycis CSF55]|uniref:Intra-flagellar transport protein 57 domain-containing protein n=1 Tax=Rozella allomycis (strain CSF55) TaxID=988480 RepID=A0A075B1C6_ROZAC|nr:Intra-flagellar transport protein 57 domain-containing protein [Rozella allomycis CSF55]|eukprot:EPZ36153.1 Intra-flagellar transport protein 57 domain-containing protein [Rozella allomycis CSF55]